MSFQRIFTKRTIRGCFLFLFFSLSFIWCCGCNWLGRAIWRGVLLSFLSFPFIWGGGFNWLGRYCKKKGSSSVNGYVVFLLGIPSLYWAAGYNMLIFPAAYHTLLWTFSCHFQYKHCVTNLPGVVGGTSSATIFTLLVLFSIASCLGCFWCIVFIGAGVMFFSFLAASSNSSLLELRYSWKISSTYSERVDMYMYARSILTLFCFSVHQNSTEFLLNCKLFNFMNPSESRPTTPP